MAAWRCVAPSRCLSRAFRPSPRRPPIIPAASRAGVGRMRAAARAYRREANGRSSPKRPRWGMGPPKLAVHVDIDGESIWALIRCDETSLPLPAARGGRFGIDCMYPDGRLKPHRHHLQVRPQGQPRRQKASVPGCSSGRTACMSTATAKHPGRPTGRPRTPWRRPPRPASRPATSCASSGVPDGQVLMTLGEPGVAGGDDYHFRSPAGVVTAPNGDIFVADGHGSNNRIVKYAKDAANSSQAWGKTGYAPGEFRTAHCNRQWTSAAACSCAIQRQHADPPDLRSGGQAPRGRGTSSRCHVRAASPSR